MTDTLSKNIFIIHVMCSIEMFKLFSRTHLTVYGKWNIVTFYCLSHLENQIKSETAMFGNPRLKLVSYVSPDGPCFIVSCNKTFTLLYKYFMNFANENVVLFYIYFPSQSLLIRSGPAKITWLLFTLRGQIISNNGNTNRRVNNVRVMGKQGW